MKIHLSNCNPEPLSAYLKGLGLFRVLSIQKCQSATAWWESNNFVIESPLNREEIVSFIMDEYLPSPIFSPWNKGSFIFMHRPDHWNKNGVYSNIMSPANNRFKSIRSDIERLYKTQHFSYRYETPQEFVERFDIKKLQKNKNKENKSLLTIINNIYKYNQKETIHQLYDNKDPEIIKLVNYYEKNIIDFPSLIAECRASLSDNFVEWLDACVVLDSNLKKMIAPLLGTGGNEGDLEYATKFLTYAVDMLLKNKKNSQELLEAALFGTNTNNLKKDKIGKFYPGKSGGYNQGNGIENKDFHINPWDFIFLIEGLFLWSNSISKKNNSNAKNYLMSPFTVKLFQAGYPSAQIIEAKAFETWIPIWKNPVHIEELYNLFATGQAVFNNKDARNGLEFMQAIKTLGVDKGIDQFTRYITSIRKGTSNFLSIPVSNLTVGYENKIILSREINSIINKFKNSRPENPPASYETSMRILNTAAYNFTVHPDIVNTQGLLQACGLAETLAWKNRKSFKRPLGLLSPKWISYADDNSTEFRIALAIASVSGDIGNMRHEIEPVDQSGKNWVSSNIPWTSSWIGNNLSEKLVNVVHRRLIKALQAESKQIPLDGRFSVSMEEVSMYIDGLLDESKIENLIIGLSMIDWNGKGAIIDHIREELERHKIPRYPVNRAYAVIKAALLNDGEHNVIESRLIPLLKANRILDAVKIAETRVFIKNQLYMDTQMPDSGNGIRIAAALLIPIDYSHQKIYNMLYGKKEMLKNE